MLSYLMYAMKPFLLHQLERYAQRLEELDFLLSQGDIMSDMNQFLKLSREHADVSAVAKRYVIKNEARTLQQAKPWPLAAPKMPT